MAPNPLPMDVSTFDPTQVDYSALDAAVSSAQVRVYRTTVRAQHRADPSISTSITTATSAVSIVFLVIFGGGFLFVLGSFLVTALATGASGSGAGALPAFLLVPTLIAALCSVVVIGVARGSAASWTRRYRLSGFAAANGLDYATLTTAPVLPGCIFTVGDSRFGENRFHTSAGRYAEWGNYRYSTGSGKSRSTHYWGYLAIKLDRNLPNIVLDSKANNALFGASNLPEIFSRDQILPLEGDFDKYFTLYCPKEYEQDALYVLTPDLMALLIDDAAPFDVEIIDDWILFYSARRFVFSTPADLQRLFTILHTVGAKAASQTAAYHDDRVGVATANIVAPQGQRLRHGVSVTSLVFVGVFAVIWIWGIFHGH